MSFTLLWLKKNLRNKKSLIICSIVLALSFSLVTGALVFTVSMINGMENRIVHLSCGHIKLNSPDGVSIDSVSSDKVISGFSMIYSSNDTAEVLIKGVSVDYFKSRSKYLNLNSFPDSSKALIISSELSEKLKVKEGDYLALMILSDSETKSIRPDVCIVGGLYDSGYSEIDSNIVFTSSEYASMLYPSDSDISYEYILDNYSEQTMKDVKSKLKGKDFEDWRSANYNLYMNFQSSNQSIVLVLFVLILFSSFLTLSMTQQVINENRRNIAISKLLGASDSQLIFSTSFTVLSCVIISLFIGTFTGILLGNNISSFINLIFGKAEVFKNYLLDFDVIIPWKSIIFMFASEIFISFLFILLTSLKSKKINPILLFR